MAADDGLRPIDVDPHARSKTIEDGNFENFVSNWEHYRERLIVFLGAGASVGARNRSGSPLPTAFHLRNSLWEHFMTPQGETFDPKRLGLMSLEHAAALIERHSGREALLDHVVKCFQVEAPLWQHAVLRYLKPSAMFTTNYDNLVEKGWRLRPNHEEIGDLRLYYRDEDPDNGDSIRFYKPHGTIDRAKQPVSEGGLVLTQFDYLEMLNPRRAVLRRFLQNLNSACVLFIGYSFQDLDIAAELFVMRNPVQKRTIPWYAVFPRNDQNVRAMYDERYGIRQINRNFLDFVADLDDRKGFIPEEWKYSRIAGIKGIATSPTNCKAAELGSA